MALAEVQKILVKIYTDERFRQKFFLEPEKTGRQFGLNPAEISNLVKLTEEQLKTQVSYFANSLYQKRLSQIYKFLPLTHKQLGKQFNVVFSNYAAAYLPSGPDKYREDAIQFAAYLKEFALNNQGLFLNIFPWQVELAIYEAMLIKINYPEFRFSANRFKYPVAKIFNQLVEGQEVCEIKQKPNIIIYYRVFKEVRKFVF